jgi:hypothetical protein
MTPNQWDALRENVDYMADHRYEPGLPRKNLMRGKLVVKNGEFIAEKGIGRFLKRKR